MRERNSVNGLLGMKNKMRTHVMLLLMISAVVGVTACGGGGKGMTEQQAAVKEEQGAAGNKQQQAAGKEESGAGETTETAALKPEQLPQAMIDGKYNLIYKQFSKEFKGQIGESDFAKAAGTFVSDISAFHTDADFTLNGLDQRIWVDPSGQKGILAAFDEQGTILGIQIQEFGGQLESDKQFTSTTFSLPFKGSWFVFWGGNNVLLNYHYEHDIQRYAYDIVQTKDGFSYEGDPKKNESYFAFGKEILSPADGVVVEVVNDVPDNVPVGVMNEEKPAGNQVVIEHKGEFSILAHLKQGSVTKKVGDKVKKGEVIGLLGNSGNSSEPHLHFQVSDGKDLFESRSLQVKWENDLRPKRGETIQGGE